MQDQDSRTLNMGGVDARSDSIGEFADIKKLRYLNQQDKSAFLLSKHDNGCMILVGSPPAHKDKEEGTTLISCQTLTPMMTLTTMTMTRCHHQVVQRPSRLLNPDQLVNLNNLLNPDLHTS